MRVTTSRVITLIISLFLLSEQAASLARVRSNAECFLMLTAPQGQQQSASVGSAQDDLRALQPGTAIERELSGGEAHTYRITLAAGQFLHVVIDQRGIDVVVTLAGPNGARLVEADSPNGTLGPEAISLIVETSGDYRLEVRSPKKSVAAARYEVKVEDLRAATPQDNDRVAAERSFTEARQLLRAQGTAAALPKAVGKYEKALTLYRAVGDRYSEAMTLHSIGWVYEQLGEYQQALNYYSQALPLRQAVEDRSGEANTLNSIGLIYSSLGEYQQALNYYSQTLPLLRAISNRRGEAKTLTNTGWVYDRLGEHQQALAYYGRALSLNRAIEDRRGEADVLNNIGLTYNGIGEYQKALNYDNQALSLYRDLKDRRGEATALHNLGLVSEHLGKHQQALDYYNQALPLRRVVGDRSGEAITLHNIGRVCAHAGEHQQALDYFNQALGLSQTFGDRRGEAAALYGIARVERNLGVFGAARTHIEDALDILETLRSKVVSENLRASYSASVQPYYEFYIGLLMQLHQQRPTEGYDALALQASERARARSLLELLIEARADIRQGVDPALLERELALRQLLNAKVEHQLRLLSGKQAEAQAAVIEKEIDALTTKYWEVEAQIRAQSPRYAALTKPEPLTLREIQTEVLDANTLLLEYSLGDERSYLWAVSRSSIASFTLPKRAEIEAAALRVTQLLAERGTPEEFQIKADSLSQLLLGPVAPRLGRKRLVFVVDGALQYVPFAALPAPSITTTTTTTTASPILPTSVAPPAPPGSPRPYMPLVIEHEIVGLPSASVLATLRRQLTGRQPAPKSVAVLADPVFSENDERVKARSEFDKAATPAGGEMNFVNRDFVRAAEAARHAGLMRAGVDFRRLPESRREAEHILALVPRTDVRAALDFDASQATAVSAELKQYRIIHFATHGFINPARPELSGLALSLVNEKGEPQDGFLSVPEVFNMTLPAELVVLSGCQTGLGKQIRGEGLIGLARGFMHAGAPRVMASLWTVQDQATAKLMARFYRVMLTRGQRPAAALRRAQISMWRSQRWSAPHQWAGFVFQGEWR